MIISPLYHWSPTERRELIRKEGLQIYSRPVAHSGPESYPYISLSPSPARAWSLSGDIELNEDYESWDLWQVFLAEEDSVRVRAEFGSEIHEVKIMNVIPPDRIWYVGSREPESARP